MGDITIPLNIQQLEAGIRADAKKRIDAAMNHAVGNVIDELFRPRFKTTWEDIPEGYLRTFIRQRIEEYVTTPEFEQHIQSAIVRHVNTAADEAVEQMLKSAARKRVFTAVPHQTK